MTEALDRDPDAIRVPARYYQRMLELLSAQSIDPEAIIQAAGLSASELADAEASLTLPQVETLVSGTVAASKRTDLAFDLGKVLKLTSHSIVGFGMLSSPNIDYALRLVSRYFGLVMPSFRMRYHCDDQRAEIRFEPVVSMSPECLQFHIEAIAVATHVEARELLMGHMPRYELYLSFSQPPHHARYAELSEARIHFGADDILGTRSLFPPEIARQPLAMSDSAALTMAEERCHAMLEKVVAKRRVSEWVEMMLREARGGLPSLDELARSLNLSTRSLDRHLKREGVGFRALRNQVQVEKARELLSRDSRSITRIAHELGYSDAANFTRAFRKETGMSPTDYRSSSQGLRITE